MKASEARKIAKTNEFGKLEPILNTIKGFADIGRFECYVYSDLPSTVRFELIKLGYAIGDSVFDQRDGSYTTKISW